MREDIDQLAAKRRHMREYWVNCRRKMVGLEEAQRQFYQPHKVDGHGQESKHKHRSSYRTYSEQNLEDHHIGVNMKNSSSLRGKTYTRLSRRWEPQVDLSVDQVLKEAWRLQKKAETEIRIEEFKSTLDQKIELMIERVFAKVRRKPSQWEQHEKYKPTKEGDKELQPSIDAEDEENNDLDIEDEETKIPDITPKITSSDLILASCLAPPKLNYESDLPLPVSSYAQFQVPTLTISVPIPIATDPAHLVSTSQWSISVQVSIGSIQKVLTKQSEEILTWGNTKYMRSRIDQEVPRKKWFQPQLQIHKRWIAQFKFRRKWIQRKQLKVQAQIFQVQLGVPNSHTDGPKENKFFSWIVKKYEDSEDLRTNPFQEGENDAAQESSFQDPVKVPVGPITRARAKKFKEAMHGLIQEVWAQEMFKRPIGEDDHRSPSYINLIACEWATN